MQSHAENPYAPPQPYIRESTAHRLIPRKPKAFLRTGLWLLLFFCAIHSAVMMVWFGAAVYEVVTLQDGDYGQHTQQFRNSYLRSAATALLLTILTLVLCVVIRRFIRRLGVKHADG